MKHIKTYEIKIVEPSEYDPFFIDSWDLGKLIEKICEPWKQKLNLQEFIIVEAKSSLYIKMYNELNQSSYNNFAEFFNMLNELRIWWRYTDGRNLILDYSNVNPDDVKMYVDAKNYNL